uniref:Uncharacterized protein n=1 Tax=Pipistrellus kuhlii TaxID=59472 RepID=A0A7J7RJS6_PIPKU|nr:hypothetical protein mPipKuh1_010537 [Pipistrellus kuhlii]
MHVRASGCAFQEPERFRHHTYSGGEGRALPVDSITWKHLRSNDRNGKSQENTFMHGNISALGDMPFRCCGFTIQSSPHRHDERGSEDQPTGGLSVVIEVIL